MQLLCEQDVLSLFKLPCIANLAMSEEVEDGTEVLRVTIYQECSALILEGIIV